MPYHWGRYRGLAQDMKRPPLAELLLSNVFFDTCVYHQPGIELLLKVIPVDNILFASEMVGAVRGIDPETGHHFDDTRRYIDQMDGLPPRTRQRSSKAMRAACSRGSARAPHAQVKRRNAQEVAQCRINHATKEESMKTDLVLRRRRLLRGVAVAAATSCCPAPAFAADPLKIGLILPLTGPFASTGKQIEAACRLYIAKNGDTVAGRKVELIVKDDTGLAPETTKRIAQELVVQDKVNVLAGLRPDAAGARGRAGRDRGEGADDRDGGGHRR